MKSTLYVLVLLALVLAACAPATSTPPPQTPEQAAIQRVLPLLPYAPKYGGWYMALLNGPVETVWVDGSPVVALVMIYTRDQTVETPFLPLDDPGTLIMNSTAVYATDEMHKLQVALVMGLPCVRRSLTTADAISSTPIDCQADDVEPSLEGYYWIFNTKSEWGALSTPLRLVIESSESSISLFSYPE